MSLWIRSQDKERLGEIVYLELKNDDYGFYIIGWRDKFEGTRMATYKTKERVLEVLDTFEEEISSTTQMFDYKLSDLYHKLENMNLDSKKCYRLCKELKSVLSERRLFKNNLTLFREYQHNKQKLINGKANREILVAQIYKEKKILENSKYHNRIYSEEELLEKIGE